MSKPQIALFTSIPGIAGALLESDASSLSFHIISDAEALGGYGGTVEFAPHKLSEETRRHLSRAEILITEPSVLAALLKYDPTSLPSLKWCQSTYAGVDPLFNAKLSLPLPFQVTRFAGKFGPPMAEWCMARIISHERGFEASARDQKQKEWAGSRKEVTEYRYLSALTLTVLGCGDIGACIARAAKAFGMKTVGFTRTPRQSDNPAVCSGAVDEFTTDLKQALQVADYIVSVMPSTSITRGILDGNALASAAKASGGKCPVFLNVGRGDIIDEKSLVNALDSHYISAAILDVFETEPLPKDSLLWSRPDVVVSPHVSGLTQAKDVPDIFLENYKRYMSGEELFYGVDWSTGY